MTRILTITLLLVTALANATNTRTQTNAKTVGVGQTAPDFTLVDHQGRKVTLSDSRGKNPVVLVFYRGYW
jgi:cytochrome oxidase Cu insertion factor (SCO1/SenC/PrrC family)